MFFVCFLGHTKHGGAPYPKCTIRANAADSALDGLTLLVVCIVAALPHHVSLLVFNGRNRLRRVQQ